jgi:nucleoside-diphosphate-sugar epimerase
MWNHVQLEQENFYKPTVNLIDCAVNAGVERFLMTSTIAITKPSKDNSAINDFSKPSYTGFWPHIDYLVDIDAYMQKNAHRGMKMISLRLGHFVGAGNKIGLVSALVPRLRTYLVPWLSGGNSRLPLVADTDLAKSFVAASFAKQLQDYESFNICGTAFPTTREVVEYIANQTGAPTPFFSVPYPIGYVFAWLMEKLFPVLPGKAPFLTRSIVHLAEDWQCETAYAERKLGYHPQKHWNIALDEALVELKLKDYPWPALAQNKGTSE